MSEERLEGLDDLKGSRRSRKDQQGRDYICGCGKKYLSYPALYTHIKTKHNGNQPEGTQKISGPPTKPRAKVKIDEKFLKDALQWVALEHLNILNEWGDEGMGETPPANRIKKDLVGKQLWEAFNTLSKTSSVSLDKKSSLETVMIVYLLGAGQFCPQSVMNYYCRFARYFRNCFSQHAVEIFQACFKGDECKIKQISVQQCKMAPIICDFLVRFYIPNENPDQHFINIMELLTHDFCKWMFLKKLTNVQINFSKKYEIKNKELIETKSKQKRHSHEKSPRKKSSEDHEGGKDDHPGDSEAREDDDEGLEQAEPPESDLVDI